MKHSPGNIRIAKIFKEHVEDKLDNILSTHNLRPVSVGLYRQASPRESNDPAELNTLVVETRSSNTKSMEAAAIEMCRLFEVHGEVSYPAIEVEVRDNQKMEYNVSRPFPDDAALVASIHSIKLELFHHARELLAPFYTSIAFHSRMHKLRPHEKPKPTVIVLFREKSVLEFNKVEGSFLNILGKCDTDINLKLLPGWLDFASGSFPRPVRLTDAEKLPVNGS